MLSIRFQVLAIRVVGNRVILGKPDTFGKSTLNFFIRWCNEKYNFPLLFSSKEIFEFFFLFFFSFFFQLGQAELGCCISYYCGCLQWMIMCDRLLKLLIIWGMIKEKILFKIIKVNLWTLAICFLNVRNLFVVLET